MRMKLLLSPSVLFLYADYYSLHQNTLEKISRRFEDKVTIKYAMSIHSYQPSLLHADLIISTVETPFPQPSIIIHPFLIEKDMNQLENTITKMLAEKNKNKLKEFLFDLFDPRLFYTNMNMDRTQLIQTLCNDAIRLDYADASFTTDVFAREHMSSTAFEDAAVPHSLERKALSVWFCVRRVWNGERMRFILSHCWGYMMIPESCLRRYSII